MHPPGASTVLVRYGEIGIKSDQVRTRMESRLQENIRAMLQTRDLHGSVQCRHKRIYVETQTASIDAVTDAVTDVFGVVSASPAVRVEPTMADITTALASAAKKYFDGTPFAVRARRAGPQSAHPFTSTDIEREGGSAVYSAAEEAGFDPKVDLERPGQTYSVECREDAAYVFLERRDGPGGLPLGSQQPLVALVSGGIDSPVAAWLAMKRGSSVYPLYVDLGAFGGVDHRMRAAETVDGLQRFAPNVDCRLRIAPGGEAIEQIAAETSMYRMLIARRFMFRVAEGVADSLGAVGIVTGESVGQKSSQTATNLRVTSAATELPVHRPLLTADKSTITDRARDIGTYEDSTIDTGCHLLAPENPATRPALGAVEAAEPDSLNSLLERTVAETSILESDDTIHRSGCAR